MHRRVRRTATAAVVTSLALGASTAPPPAALGVVRGAPAMRAPRAAHTATPLPDGSVLVVGGMAEGAGEEAARADAERFVPAAAVAPAGAGGVGRFVPAGRMRAGRQSHTATALADGRVLVAGGYGAGGAVLATAELYDPRTGAFTPTGPMLAARAGHEAVRLADGRVLVVGGLGPGWAALASAELYDPVSGRFTPTGDLREARESHTAVRLADGSVLVTGGHAGRGPTLRILRSCERYDPARRDPATGRAGAFAAAAPLRLARHKHDAVALADGRVLVLGGADARDDRGTYRSAEVYDPARDRWSPTGDLVVPHYKHAGTSLLLADGGVLVASGAAVVERYDPTRGAFAAVPLAPGAARPRGSFAAVAPLGGPGAPRAAAAAAPDGALITGGYGGGRGATAEAWVYQPR
jgi:hypothetical protein